MKTKLRISVIFMALALSLGYAQNKSNGAISTTITPALLPPGNTEAFRFRPGLITQLDFGTAFDFVAASQWTAFGRLTTPNQTLYGFRAQRAGRGLTFGFTGAVETTVPTLGSPLIEWIGNGTVDSGDLLFKAAPNATSTISNQIFKLRADGTGLFSNGTSLFTNGNPGSNFFPFNSDSPDSFPTFEINSNNKTGLVVYSNNAAIDGNNYAANFISQGAVNACVGLTSAASGGQINTGLRSDSRGSFNSSQAIGILSTASNGQTNYGAYTIVNGNQSSAGFNYGAFYNVQGNTAVGSVNYGVYATATGLNPIAGYFNGKVFATSFTTISDKSLKKDIKSESSILEKIQQLNPVTYNFVEEDKEMKLHLPKPIQHGFVAQELEKVFPEFVEEVLQPIFNDKNIQTGTKSLKSVNYIGMISVLTQGLKEMSNEMQILKDKIAVLENKGVLGNGVIDEKNIENGYSLSQNVPNPFNSSTVINYVLPENSSNASILIFNLNGETIKEYKIIQSKGNITIESGTLSKGMYLYSLVLNGKEIATKKMIAN
jgi:Chaperone of endosialidase/Secretion system C-terminal sorting domain